MNTKISLEWTADLLMEFQNTCKSAIFFFVAFVTLYPFLYSSLDLKLAFDVTRDVYTVRP